VDEHTGRTMPGRRWSEGLHQAIEAKEGVNIQAESQTLASTTFQNYFRLYKKLSGMTGTADTEAAEFRQIYGLDVVVIPTHRPMIRKDEEDLVYITKDEKYDAIVAAVREFTEKGAPVLLGTATIATSEYLSERLTREKIPHQVLNAKFHRKEAEIISQAGKPGTITIATNMAGRGTDIVLGGNPDEEIRALDNPDEQKIAGIRRQWQEDQQKVLAAGGLHIIGSERHESRRIDNQLRGRAGRQGDPGYTRFFLSMEDDLMRIFGSDRMSNMMRSIGLKEGEAIEHRWLTRSIENAQRKVEGRNFDVRKNLLEYDDVANDQRRVIYSQREKILTSDDLSESIALVRKDVLREVVQAHMPPGTIEDQWDIAGLEKVLAAEFSVNASVSQWLVEDKSLHTDGIIERIDGILSEAYQDKEEQMRANNMSLRAIEQLVMLQVLDRHWKEHLANMDHLRQGIHLRGYGQRNPKQEYKREAFELFQYLLNQIEHEAIRMLCNLQVRREDEMERLERQREEMARQQAQSMTTVASRTEDDPGETAESQPYVREGRKMGRNEPCWCGSGKKYKQCHGKLEV